MACNLIQSLLLLSLVCLGARPALADQMIIRVTLNQEDKGDLFVDKRDKGDFLIKTEDLKAIGFRVPLGQITRVDGEEYRSLASMSGVSFSFDEGNLALAITAPPSDLGRETVDFQAPQPQKIYYPADSSVFLNYGADYLTGSAFSSGNFTLTNQLGARTGNLLFLTDSVFTKAEQLDRFVRLQSSFTYDDRALLRRYVAGDFFASSGDLGSTLNLGGISYSKVYRIDPYFISYPTLGLSGQVALPSEAKIYLNGVLMKTEHFSPGEFELRNLTPYGTAGTVEVVLKDAFGREQRINYPFYFGGASLLKKGLQEYSYNLGFLRDNYGNESNRYSDLAFSAFHRYGLSDTLTVGLRGEGKSDLINLGPQATLLLGRAGLLNLSLAGSTGGAGKSGVAGTAGYSYQGLKAGANFAFSGYTRDYSIVSTSPLLVPKLQSLANLSYTDTVLGSLTAGYSITRMYQGQDSNVASIGYSRNLTGALSLTTTYRNIKQTGYANEVFVALNYSPKPDLTLSANYQSTAGSKSAQLEAQKNPPIGEGYGYRVALARTEAGGEASTIINPSFQYNGRHGIYQAEFNGQESPGHSSEQYHLAASGALVYAGRTFGATRPVYDSFGLVKVGDLEGVKVLLNSQDVGSTDAKGKLFIPELGSFYQNQVAIDTTQVSIDYFLTSVAKTVSPPLRSGSCIPFLAKRLQPITGSLKARVAGDLKPVEFREASLEVQGKNIAFPTGSGGVFDIDLSQSEEFKKITELEESGCSSFAAGPNMFIKSGSYRGSVEYAGKQRGFTLTIPDTADSLIDLGVIIIEIAPEPAPAPPAVVPSVVVPAAPVAPVLPAPVKKPKPENDLPGNLVQVEDTPVMEVNFKFGTTIFASPEDRAILTMAVELLKAYPEARIFIEGYTDQIGTHQYNDLLSKKRALSVAAELKKLGVPATKIAKIRWFGKRPLKCDSLDEACREQNRRVVILLVTGD